MEKINIMEVVNDQIKTTQEAPIKKVKASDLKLNKTEIEDLIKKAQKK